MSQPYHSLEAELHDAFWEAEDDGSELKLMAGFLKKHPGPALEIGAGSGRLMFPLVQMGYELEGLELSRDMLKLAEARAAKLNVAAVIHEGDMATWRSGRKFSALLAPAFTLQLAADPEAVLCHWHTLIENHGGLYLTVFMPYAELLEDLPENEWYEDHRATFKDGQEGLLTTRHRLDREKQLVHREHRYQISGPPPMSYDSAQTIRWFEHPELLELLANCGFRSEHLFLDFNPKQTAENPESIDFDGIMTYYLTRIRVK